MVGVESAFPTLRRHLGTQSIGHGLKPSQARAGSLEVRFGGTIVNMELVHVLVGLHHVIELRARDLGVFVPRHRPHHCTTVLEISLPGAVLREMRVKRPYLLVPPHQALIQPHLRR